MNYHPRGKISAARFFLTVKDGKRLWTIRNAANGAT